MKTKIQQNLEVPHIELKNFLLSCADTSEERTMIITATILAMWQEITRNKANRSPSFLLLNTENSGSDHINDFIDQLACTKQRMEKLNGNGYYKNRAPKIAIQDMLRAYLSQEKQIKSGTTPLSSASTEENIYHTAREAIYGKGDISPYSRAWDPEFGLITDLYESVILKIGDDVNLQSFKNDALNEPFILQKPFGLDQQLSFVPKTFCISGFVKHKDCDDELVNAILNIGLPLFLLPHSIDKPVQFPNLESMACVYGLMKNKRYDPIYRATCLPEDNWTRQYENYLWERLHKLPFPCRLPLLEAITQIEEICRAISLHAALLTNHTEHESSPVSNALFMHTLRGLMLSISGLAWYGHGFDSGCSLTQTQKLLSRLKTVESMSLRDVQRVGRFKSAAERDQVISRLQEEGLVQLEGNQLSVLSHADFIKRLHNHKELPQMPDKLFVND